MNQNILGKSRFSNTSSN